MADLDVSFSRDIGAEAAAGATPIDAVSSGELGAGVAAGGDMPRSICQTAGDASGAPVGGGRADQSGR
ncbi:MAG: hypothetical protein ACREGK_13335 [Geminicoccales bacterium]